jgi:hypothetical protein
MAIVTRRTIWLGAIAACGGLLVVIGILLFVPVMLYPPLSGVSICAASSWRTTS